MTASFTGEEPVTLQVFWKRLDDDKFENKTSPSLQLNPDGKLHTYHLKLNGSPEYRGLVTGLAIEPTGSPRPGDELGIQSIGLNK
jgi:hypothetical protein